MIAVRAYDYQYTLTDETREKLDWFLKNSGNEPERLLDKKTGIEYLVIHDKPTDGFITSLLETFKREGINVPIYRKYSYGWVRIATDGGWK